MYLFNFSVVVLCVIGSKFNALFQDNQNPPPVEVTLEVLMKSRADFNILTEDESGFEKQESSAEEPQGNRKEKLFSFSFCVFFAA